MSTTNLKLYPIEMYLTNVLFVFGNRDRSVLIDYLGEEAGLSATEVLELANNFADCSGLTAEIESPKMRKSFHIVYCTDYKSYEDLISTLTHEITHVSLKICNTIKYDPVVQQEPFCYLQGYLMKIALEEIKRVKVF